MNIGEAIGKPFQIIWKHKVLWALGAIGGIVGAALNAFSIWFVLANRSLLSITGDTYRLPPDFMYTPYYRWIRSLDRDQIPLSLLIAVGILFLILLINILISIFAQSSIICGTRMADEGSADMRFGTIVKEGWKPFGKLVLFSLFTSVALLAIYTVLVLVLMPVIANSNEEAVALMILTLCCSGMCIILPLAFFISLYVRLITVSIVHDNLRVLKGFKLAWQTLRKSLGMFLLFHLTVIGITIAINILPGIFNWVAQTGTSIATMVGGSNNGNGTYGAILVAAVIGLVDLIFSSFILTYTTSAWTLAFRRVAYPPVVQVPPLPVQIP